MAREFQSRARQVCTRCHERKVKCDLQTRRNGPCSNCCREATTCGNHIGVRKKRAASRRETNAPGAGLNHITTSPNEMGIGPSRVQTPDRQGVGRTASKLPSPNPSTGIESSGPSNPATARGGLSYNDTGFYGHSQPRPSRGIDEIPSFSLSDTDTTSQEPPIWKTPSVSLSKVLVELYAQQLFPLIPVMDSHDLNGADVAPIVQQAVYLGGSMMRRAKDYPGNLKPKDFFVRIKRLLFLDDQPDAFAVLKSLCILSCWSYKSPTLATLDSPWQWSGMAMRLAMQLGLHKEATYTHLESRKSARRVWWFLFVADTVQSLCYARHPMLRRSDFDVELPNVTDFECADVGAMAFCHSARLSLILGEIERFAHRGQPIIEEETRQLVRSLQFWFDGRPPDLYLFDEQDSRRPYSRVLNELHIMAFVAVILIYLLPGSHRQRRDYCAAAIAASLCIDQLYGEIMHRSETSRLIPIHSWFILFSVVPRYYCVRTVTLYGQVIPASDQQPMLAIEVLSEIAEAYPSGQWVKERVDKMIQGIGAGLDPSGPGGRAAPGTPHQDLAVIDDTENFLSTTDRPFDFQGVFNIPAEWCPGLDSLRRNFDTGATHHSSLDQYPVPAGEWDWNILWPEFSLDDLNTLPDFSIGMDSYGL